jgi:hypothetical protein
MVISGKKRTRWIIYPGQLPNVQHFNRQREYRHNLFPVGVLNAERGWWAMKNDSFIFGLDLLY